MLSVPLCYMTQTNALQHSIHSSVHFSVLHCLWCRYLGPDYGDFNKPDAEVTGADLPQLAHESFPLCMLVCLCC